MKTATGAQAALTIGLAVLFFAAAAFIPQQAVSGSAGTDCAPDLSKNHPPHKVERRCPLR
jgi:hypothetical protein